MGEKNLEGSGQPAEFILDSMNEKIKDGQVNIIRNHLTVMPAVGGRVLIHGTEKAGIMTAVENLGEQGYKITLEIVERK